MTAVGGFPANLYVDAMTASYDVIVIGAGAAGIGAGRELARRNANFCILEARDRVGGRAWTSNCGTPWPFDLGCEWLHSADRNVLATLASELGIALDKAVPPWRRRHLQRGFGDAEQDAFAAESDAFFARLEDAAETARRTGRDRPASEFIDPAARWSGFLDAISTYYNGAPLDRVSVLDFDAYTDTEVNWRAVGGYGALIEKAAAGLPIRLDCPVTRVDTTGRAITVESNAGTLIAGAVIVTISSNMVAAGAIAFAPALDDHRAAAAGLPLGIADKVFFALDQPDVFQPDTRLIGAPERRDTGSYALRSHGRPIVEGYFGGDYARHLEAGGPAAFFDAARREISEAFGRDVGAMLRPIAATAWASDPYALGSYSHALPGHADARAKLAAPVDGRLLFAGEATSPHFFSTAHGAFEEGAKAAAVLAKPR